MKKEIVLKTISKLFVSMLIVLNVLSLGVFAQEDVITIGTLALSEPMVTPLVEELNNRGYNTEIVVFDGNHLPAVALGEDEIEAVIGNHSVWLETFNQENDTNLVMVEPYIANSPLAFYSSKHDSIEDIPENATIAIPGDPSNMERSLIFLEELGLITLGEKMGEFHNLLSIEENPKNITIVETEITNTVTSLEDADAITSPPMNLRSNNMDYENYLALDELTLEYAIGLIIRDGDQEEEWVKVAQEILATDEYRAAFKEAFGESYYTDAVWGVEDTESELNGNEESEEEPEEDTEE